MKDAKGHGSDKRGGAGAMPIKGHPYHEKSHAELRYIMKDAHEASVAMRDHSPQAESKYLDQVNDAATVLGYRARGGERIVPKPSEPAAHQSGVESSTWRPDVADADYIAKHRR